MALSFQRATKSRAKLRMALIGPAGSGKTYSALAIAEHLGQPVAVIDTEHGSASKYANRFAFDVLELQPPFGPRRYVEAIHAAADYPVLIIDGLTQAWTGSGGALELHDKASARSQSGNSYVAWREVTPLHNQLVEAMLTCPQHLIVTMRAKTEYVQEKDDKGKTTVRKLGLAPVQRDGLEYEFDVVGDVDWEHRLIVTKSRCEALTDAVIMKPGQNVADTLNAWLSDGAEPVAPVTPVQAPPPAPETNGNGKTTDPARAEAVLRLNELRNRCIKLNEEITRHELSVDPIGQKGLDEMDTALNDDRQPVAKLESLAGRLESVLQQRQAEVQALL